MKAIYRARVFDPVSDYELNEIPDAILSVDSTGKIDSITPFHEAPEQLCSNAKVLEGESGLQILLPGFCDLHFHWVQDLVCDLPKDHLLEWLNDYVFPEESRFSSEEYSKERAMDFAAKLVRCGTLGGGIYSSIHEPSVIQAMEHLRGDFRLGNVVMTRNSPDYLTEQLEDVKTLCSRLQLRFGPQYVITPRFALSCDPTTLEWLGAFAREHGLYVQTHLSETKTEIVETLNYYRSFPGFENINSYLEIYSRAGLIHDQTILGHCIHLQDEEISIIARNKACIAHCPSSNAPIEERGLGSGLFDFKRMDEEGIAWALGSDIGAGPFLSMLDVMRSFLTQNRKKGIDPGVFRALYRSTVKGNSLLGYPQKGHLRKGSQADFVGFPSSCQSDPQKVLEELLERDRTEFNELPMSVVSKGELIFDSRV